MSKSNVRPAPIRPAPIKIAFLSAVRDNPGLRPCQLFKLPTVAKYGCRHFWLRNMHDAGLVEDVNQAAWMETYMVWFNGDRTGPSPVSQRRVALCLTAAGQAWLAGRLA